MFTRLKLAASDYEGLAKDLKSFISKSVLDKMATVQGGGSREHGSTLGELRRVRLTFVFAMHDVLSTMLTRNSIYPAEGSVALRMIDFETACKQELADVESPM